MCQIVFASCDVIIRNTCGAQNIQDPRKQHNPQIYPIFDCKPNSGVLSALVRFSVGVKLWRVNRGSGSCDQPAEPLQPSLASTYSQPFTPRVHKGDLMLEPLTLSHSVTPPHKAVRGTSRRGMLASCLLSTQWQRAKRRRPAQRSTISTKRLVSEPRLSGCARLPGPGPSPSLRPTLAGLKCVFVVACELRRPRVLHLSPASVKPPVSSGSEATRRSQIRPATPGEPSQPHGWARNRAGSAKLTPHTLKVQEGYFHLKRALSWKL